MKATRSTKRIYRTEEQMFPLIEKWQESGLPQASFCAEHQISLAVFGYWLRKYRNGSKAKATAACPAGSSGGFVSLSFDPPSPPSAGIALEVQLPGGVLLRFHRLPPQPYLSDLFFDL
jgi:hypothetical protein